MLVAGIVALSESQHGVVLGAQLAGFGVTRPELLGLVRRSYLTPIRRGAFCVARSAPSEWQEVVAAYLCAGGSATLSHFTAARLHRLAVAGPALDRHTYLTVVRPQQVRLARVTVRRVGRLDPADVCSVRGLRATTAARTLVDVAPSVPTAALGRLLDEGLIAGRWDVASVQATLRRAPDRVPGGGDLRRLLDARSGRGRADTHLEAAVLDALDCLRPFEVQHQVVLEGQLFVLDIAFPAFRVAVEAEGWDVRRRSRTKFDHERRRNNLLAGHGWTVVHLTSAMSPDEMRAAVCAVLLRVAAGGGGGGAVP